MSDLTMPVPAPDEFHDEVHVTGSPAVGPSQVSSESVTEIMMAKQWSGPLPPAEALAGYAKIDPKLVDRVFSMAEREAAHRHERENRELDIQAHAVETELETADDIASVAGRNQTLGVIFAFILGLAGLTVAGVCALNGAEGPAMVIGGVSLVGLVAQFVSRAFQGPGKPTSAEVDVKGK